MAAPVPNPIMDALNTAIEKKAGLVTKVAVRKSVGPVLGFIRDFISNLAKGEAEYMLATALVNINSAITSTRSGRRTRIKLVRHYRPRGPPVNYDYALAVIHANLVHDYRPPVVPVTGDCLLSAFRAAEAKRIYDQALASAQAARASYMKTISTIAAFCIILGCAVVHAWKR